MSKKTRAQLAALKDLLILSGGRRTTASNMRAFQDAIIESLSNILDDKDANDGYAGLDSNGLIDPSHLPPATGITVRTIALTGTVLDLTGLTGSIILNVTGNPTQNLTDIVNISGVDQIWICPPNTMDLTAIDGNNIRLFAATLTCYGARDGYLQMIKRGTKMYQLTYIDQYN